jgi:hypothetical protein
MNIPLLKDPNDTDADAEELHYEPRTFVNTSYGVKPLRRISNTYTGPTWLDRRLDEKDEERTGKISPEMIMQAIKKACKGIEPIALRTIANDLRVSRFRVYNTFMREKDKYGLSLIVEHKDNFKQYYVRNIKDDSTDPDTTTVPRRSKAVS